MESTRKTSALKSKTGFVLVIIYLCAITAAWVDYRGHPNQFLSDILLVLLTFPFSTAAHLLTGSSQFEVRGDNSATLIPAIILCTILVYFIGVGLGRLTLWLRARFK